MSTKTFDDFVKKKLDEAQTNKSLETVDWNKTREEWIQSLHHLYSKMEKYLKKYTEADLIQVSREKYKSRKNIWEIMRQRSLRFRLELTKLSLNQQAE